MSHFTLRARRRRLLAASAFVVAALSSVSTASAGSYVAWLCKTPPGAPAPYSVNTPTSTEGWTTANAVPAEVVLSNSCAQGGDGALSANFSRSRGTGAGTSGVGTGKWEFNAPVGTSVSRARLQYGYGVATNAADASGGAAAVGVYRDGFAYAPDHLLMSWQSGADGSKFGAAGVFDFAINATRFGFDAGCYGPANGSCGTTDQGRSSMVIGWQQLFLTDDAAPRATNAGGTALDAGPKRGIETLKFDASDEGSGIYAAQVTLDGLSVYPWQVVDTVGGRCSQVDFDSSIEREYRFARPCPLSATAVLSFDTSKVADGEHLLTAQLADAAGNTSVAVSKKITLANGNPVTPPNPGNAGTSGLPNGTGGNPLTGKVTGVVAPKASVGFKKPLSLGGKVVDAAGTPLAGAFVDVFTTVAVPGAPKVFAGTVTADAKGAFSYAVTTKASQSVEFAYSAKQASTDYLDRATAEVVVKASVSFALVKQARRGSKVRFSGVVGVDPLPKKGARVVIELRDGKRWRDTKTVRTTAGGQFAWTYAFKTRGAFTFRARLLSAVDVPAKRNQSPTRTVRIR